MNANNMLTKICLTSDLLKFGMNANIIKTKTFQNMKFDLKGQ